ncbi:MAG TPA: TetR/AcrR family transcriptional regulator [Acidimicrobiales bacterium]|nr:TetR/AcrR family transcriptional regulator [Acidimicrobiales bacterium]
MTGRRRARRGEGDALREEILAAAVGLLAETGSEEALSIRAVAARVGVTPPSIYLHFADKESLVEAVCLEAFEDFDSRLAAAAAGREDPIEVLEAIGRAYVAFALERPEQYRYMFMRRPPAGLSEPTPAELETIDGLRLVIAAVQSAQRAGLIDPAKDPLVVTYALWCTTHGLAALLIAKPHFPWGDRQALAEAAVELAINGVLTRS